ncbi:putative Amine oxidase [Nitrospira japonica]|uniref:Putative Amine oxidase n=1 Tax=Nitrospira japonica TaxID=1325564 RepID=A0A1W1I0L8_9BACT|nr:FAD-dependent oxidoreductase [Nitrospira japonica]SLM46403.1 putative Amine oxidase [Nitrospira japonica]
MIVIVGAGLAGLSTAYHLSGLPYRIYEREQDVGGLCRSYRKDGFTFDYTGHLLHFRQAEIKALVERLLAGRLQQHGRKSFIYSHQTYTEYPFQVNTFGLPPEVIRECLMGFIATLTQPVASIAPKDRSFKQWILDNLGDGMAKHFMVPFNEKLWQVSLDELTSDWVSWLVPKPELKDVINGALGIKDKAFGYNPSFLYPANDGIRVLPESFLSGIDQVERDCELIEVDTKRRRALFHDRRRGESRTEHYESLVSTIPVPELVRRCPDFPQRLKEAAAGLRWVSVYNVNLGVSREQVSDKHWIYFPESGYPFYRVGFPMSFSPSLGRSGCSSMYVEISHRPAEQRAPEQLIEQARSGLEQAGILRPDDDLVVADVKDLRYAYVYFDRHRAKAIPAILAELERRGIHSIGRYGRWEHTSMEDAIGQGKRLAEQLRGQQAQPVTA